MVRHDQPVGVHDDAGAQRVLHAVLRNAEWRAVAEEAAEKRIVGKGDALVRTTRRENTFTTAGAACFTMGAKESRMASRLFGTVCARTGATPTAAAKQINPMSDFFMGPGL